jgi:hypothetical protein
MTPDQINSSIQAVVSGLTPLAQKLNIPIQDLFQWGLRHNYAVALTDLVPLVLAVPLGVVFYKFTKAFTSYVPKDGYDHDEFHAVGAGISGILFVIVIVISCMTLCDAIVRFVSPQWATASDIVCMVKGCS